MQNQMGSYEAKTHFAELINKVSKGLEITITRHGAPVAKLVPIHTKSSANEKQSALITMRQLAKHHTLGRLKIKNLIKAGRK